MKNTIRFLFILLLWSLSAPAQRLPDYGLNRTRLTAPDGSAQLIETRPAKVPRAEPEKTYYWYSGGSVHTTQGGYSGKLLSGPYQQFDAARNLRERGLFSKGLKSGTWNAWSDAGKLLEQTTWKRGTRQGAFGVYNSEGKLLRAGHYRAGLLSGKVLVYTGADSVRTLRYKAGREVASPATSSSKPSLFKRLWPFGHHGTKRDSADRGTKVVVNNGMPGSYNVPRNNPAPAVQPVGTPSGISATAPADKKQKKGKVNRVKKGSELGTASPFIKP